MRLQSNAQVSVQLVRVASNGTETALSPVTTVPGLTYDPAIGVRIRVQATGTSPTTLRARVWSGSAAEPGAWHATATDATAALQVAGGIGLTSYLSGSATNAPVVARFDDLSATPSALSSTNRPGDWVAAGLIREVADWRVSAWCAGRCRDKGPLRVRPRSLGGFAHL